MVDDTIFALATGRVRAGVAIVRVSGPAAARAVQQLTGREVPSPRRASRRRVYDTAGDLVDDALLLWFPAPHSFTGEDVAEFHLHGGRSVIAGVLDTLAVIPGLRGAEPGEFTRRAVIHGKVNLTEAEALADLIAAETVAQRRQAIRQFDGELARVYDAWRDRLLRALAHVEAAIDFSDEDIPADLFLAVRTEAAALGAEIAAHLAKAAQARRLREGIEIVVVGPPNAGKSTLVNALANRDVAIVSPRPGTTRDVLEVPLDLGGFPVILCDTAGLHRTEDEVEAEGVRRAEQRAAAADLRIVVHDGATDGMATGVLGGDGHIPSITVVSKWDLRGAGEAMRAADAAAIAVSARTGFGVEALRQRIIADLDRHFGRDGGVAPTRARHQEGLRACLAALQRMADEAEVELAAEELRAAAQALGRITGRVHVEEVLDVIFAEFCLGK